MQDREVACSRVGDAAACYACLFNSAQGTVPAIRPQRARNSHVGPTHNGTQRFRQPLQARIRATITCGAGGQCCGLHRHGAPPCPTADRLPSHLTASPGDPSVHGASPRATPASRQSETVVLAPLGVRLPAGIGRYGLLTWSISTSVI